MANRQSPPPSASSSHPTPPASDPGDQVSAGSSVANVGPSPELNPIPPHSDPDSGSETDYSYDFVYDSDSDSDSDDQIPGQNPCPPLPSRNPAIYRLSFDQDYNHFTVGLNTGFRIFAVDPFHLKSRPSDSDSRGGIRLVTVHFSYCRNYLCLVGGGPNPVFDRNKVMIWGGDQQDYGRYLSFRTPVRNVKIRQERVVVVMLQKIFVFNFSDLKLIHVIETCKNPNGLCEITSSPTPTAVAYPGFPVGHIIVVFPSAQSKVIRAHGLEIGCMAMTPEGSLLASACRHGTSIRVFSILSRQLLKEVATGYDRADIYSLALSPEALWLAVSSNKGTVLVYSMDSDTNQLLPHSQFGIPENLQHFVGFGGEENILVIIGMNGSFHRCLFDPEAIGIDMFQLEHYNFMDIEIDRDDDLS